MQALLSFIWSLLLEFWPIGVVDKNELGVRFRLGKWVSALKPGPCISLPFIDEVYSINVTPQWVDLPAQSVETSDGERLAISGAIEYSIFDAVRVWLCVQDHEDSLTALAMGVITEHVGKRDYEQISTRRLCAAIRRSLVDRAAVWGIHLSDVKLTDLSRHDVHRIMGSGLILADSDSE